MRESEKYLSHFFVGAPPMIWMPPGVSLNHQRIAKFERKHWLEITIFVEKISDPKLFVVCVQI